VKILSAYASVTAPGSGTASVAVMNAPSPQVGPLPRR
jgi:hypothetical protein